ncbi:hypothetical protein AVEN_210511-1 [Araneus ventricosus]|uniref:Uncharacterized protein n=1 Tax=Araneus ventricosus TaxID=182803 RepID=A0A4Y2FB84_ARAVE|nr:hypothetical protein AVEN_210511-1 [Araneus ventricosus]
MNSQVITVKALSNLAIQTVSNSLVMTVTIRLSHRLSHPHCRRNSQVVSIDQLTPSVVQVRSFCTLPDRPWRHMELSSAFKHVSSPNSSPSRQNGIQVLRQGEWSRPGPCRSFHA